MSRARDLANFANNQALSVSSDLNVGINSTSPDGKLDVIGDVDVSGIVTATTGSFSGTVTANSFSGDGSNLTGVSGFATALSSTQTDPLFHVFKTPRNLTVSAGTSAFIKSDSSSGNIAFTKMSHIHVSSGATVHVGSGTTFKTNVLSLF
nr:hypothetical protein [uncultured Mediterranean phage uvMED]